MPTVEEAAGLLDTLHYGAPRVCLDLREAGETVRRQAAAVRIPNLLQFTGKPFGWVGVPTIPHSCPNFSHGFPPHRAHSGTSPQLDTGIDYAIFA